MKMQIEWAIKTKFPNDQDDYRVLASSKGKITENEFESLFRKWQSGEMPLYDNDFDPGAPWLTFAPLKRKSGEDYYYLLLRERWTEISDVRNRRIKLSECLIFPFQDIANAKMSLHDLVALLENTTLVSAASHLSQGRIPEVSSPISIDDYQPKNYSVQISEMIDRIGFARCRDLASMLINQPLSLLISPGDQTWQDRLKVFDAILGLLPYGVRAKIPLSIWAQSGSIENFRLNFCRSSSEERSNYIWNKIDSEGNILNDVDTKGYAEDLNILKRHHGLRNVIEHLSDQVNVISLDANMVRELLESLSPAILIYEKAPGCLPGCRDAIRQLFFSEAINDLDKNQIAELLALLIPGLSQDDLEIFGNYEWSEHFYQPLFSELGRALDDYSVEQEHFNAVSELVIRDGQLPRFFDELMNIIMEERERLVRERREENIIQMIGFALKVEQRLDTKSVSQWLLTAKFSDSFFYDWAIYLHDQEQVDINLFKKLLQREKKQELLPLLIVWGIDDKEFTHEMIDSVFNLDPRYLGYLFKKSIDNKTLNNFVVPFSGWLLMRKELHSFSQQLMKYINQAAHQDASKASWAALDVIRLAVGSEYVLLRLDFALTSITLPQYQEYSETFITLTRNAQESYTQQINRNLKNYTQGALDLIIRGNNLAQERLKTLLYNLSSSETLDRLDIDQNIRRLRLALSHHDSLEIIADCCAQIIINNIENKNKNQELNASMSETANTIFVLFQRAVYPNTSKALHELLNLIYRKVDLNYALGFENYLVSKILDKQNDPSSFLRNSEIEKLVNFERKRINNFIWYVDGLTPYFPENEGLFKKLAKKFFG